jgi:hypothetical protein
MQKQRGGRAFTRERSVQITPGSTDRSFESDAKVSIDRQRPLHPRKQFRGIVVVEAGIEIDESNRHPKKGEFPRLKG